MVNKHDKPSIANIADKMAGYDSFHIFEILITLGKACVADIAEKRPEMVVVYMNLKNVLSSETKVNNGMYYVGAYVMNVDNNLLFNMFVD